MHELLKMKPKRARAMLLILVVTLVLTVWWATQSELQTKSLPFLAYFQSHLQDPSVPPAPRVSQPHDLKGMERDLTTSYDTEDVKDQADQEIQRLTTSMPDFSSVKWQSQQQAVQINETLKHDKWIIVTSIVLPTDDIKFLANITGWRVVVVGDTKTPSNWSHPNCVYLSVADQEKMGLHITTRLPYRSYARKNVGYLFAVAHGAKVIYETDDDNRPLDRLQSFCIKKTMSGLLYAGKEIFNPYRHFGQSTLWPRGYPLGQVGKDLPTVYRLSDKWRTPGIQQGIVNGDPDMDAIFRLTRKKTLSRLEVTFDKAAPPVILPEGVFSPFNSQNTLFLYEALWAMYLPTTTTFRMCDIWRGYWAQRLLWEIGGRLAFFPPNAYQQRNAHSYMADAEDEKDMYFNTQHLINFLFEWTCPTHFSFFQCVYRLSVDMAEQEFWNVSEVEVVTSWLNDLLKIGYQEPSRLKIADLTDSLSVQQIANDTKVATGVLFNTSKNILQTELDRRWAHGVSFGSFINFVAAEQIPPSIHNDATYNISLFSRHSDTVAKFCGNHTQDPFTPQFFQSQEQRHFHDILLIVIFNWPLYTNVNYLEVAYRFLFPNIVYCGEKPEQFSSPTRQMNSELSFIEASIARGLIGYACTIKAMQMGYNVQGYLVIGDDDIVNFWNFFPYNKDLLWVNGDVEIFLEDTGTPWYWWNNTLGGRAYKSSMNTLQKIKLVSQGSKLPQKFFRTHADNLGGFGKILHAIGDVYYIPSRLRDSAIFFLNVFEEQKLMLEIALSTLFFGLEPRQNIQIFHPKDLWGKEVRANPWKYYNSNLSVLHPVKLSISSHRAPYCSTYLSQVLAWGHSHTQDKLSILQKRFEDMQVLYRMYINKYLDQLNKNSTGKQTARE